MKIVTLDFETLYDQEYSLSKMTTEEYVRDERFEIILVSIKIGDGKARWFPKPQVPAAMKLLAKLAETHAFLAHNMAFDGFILSHHYGIVPRFYLDTLSMARPWHAHDIGVSLAKLATHYGLGAKGDAVLNAKGLRYAHFAPAMLENYAEYCCNDTELTYALFDRLMERTHKQELLIIDRTVRMFCDPKIILDTALLETYLAEVVEEKAKTLATVEELCTKADLMSNDKLANVLMALGVDPPVKLSAAKTKTAGKPVYTWAFGKTDREFTELLEHEDPLVSAVVGARLGVKSTIEETRAARFLGMSQRGPMPVALRYSAAITWRWGGDDKQNLQNLKRGGTLRKALTAPPGFVICSVDSSNIELRGNHTLAGQLDSVQAFKDGRDLYCEFASILYKRPITKADVAERFIGKLSHLSLGYSCSWEKFRHICRLYNVHISEDEAKQIVGLWREIYWAVPKFWRKLDNAIELMAAGATDAIDTFGLVSTGGNHFNIAPHHEINYPGLCRDDEDKWTYKIRNRTKFLYGAKADENIVQCISRNIVAEQLLKISVRYPVVLTVHDEVVYLAPDEEKDEALAFGIKIMSTSPTWWPEIPLAAEGEVGRSYS